MVEQAKLRFGECPFPGCHWPSRPAIGRGKRKQTGGAGTGEQQEHGSDLDHREESGPREDGVVEPCSPPCRGHHRPRPSPDWTDYDPATGFTWTSPQGYRYTDPAATPAAGDIPGG